MARLCARKYKNRTNSPCKRPEVDAIKAVQGQERLSILQVVEAVVLHLALGSVDEGAIGVLSMPKRSVATDVVTGAVELMDHGDVDDQVSLVSDVCIPNLEVASPSPAAGGDVATLGAKARCANDLLHHG